MSKRDFKAIHGRDAEDAKVARRAFSALPLRPRRLDGDQFRKE
jgi:hypothetical protein